VRILVIEDSDSIRHMIEALMSARGHQVLATSTGAKGIDMAFAHPPPDTILLDLHLPGTFDGFQVVERLRADDRTKSIPIIVISAMADNDSKQRVLETGANAFYSKPFSPTALLKEIESMRRRSIPDT
jgi:DNA-binding response OmpR family regulator